MNKDERNKIFEEELIFSVRRAITQRKIDKALALSNNRYEIRMFTDVFGDWAIQALINFATQEEQVFDYPADWWQWCKERWFPRWLKRKSPVRMSRIWAVHKYPEVNIPQEFVGQEFVHFKVADLDKLNP